MKETFLTIPGAPSFALMGDFHNGDPDPILRSLSRRKPAFICIAGDTIIAKAPEEGLIIETQKNVLPFLRGCVETAPTFLSLGNHDAVLVDKDLAIIEKTGVILLDNKWNKYENIWIGGLTSHSVLDQRAYRADYPSAEKYLCVEHFVKDHEDDSTQPPRLQWDHQNRPAGEDFPSRTVPPVPWKHIKSPDLSWLDPLPPGYKLLLSHHPEYYPLLPKEINLICSAHAHGGQWRFFGRGVFSPGQGLFPKYTSGLYSNMLVTRGLTNTTSIPRLFNPTEIVYINQR